VQDTTSVNFAPALNPVSGIETEYSLPPAPRIYKDESAIAMRKGFDGGQTITVLTNLGAGGKEYSDTERDEHIPGK
jgi:alpha-amylase